MQVRGDNRVGPMLAQQGPIPLEQALLLAAQAGAHAGQRQANPNMVKLAEMANTVQQSVDRHTAAQHAHVARTHDACDAILNDPNASNELKQAALNTMGQVTTHSGERVGLSLWPVLVVVGLGFLCLSLGMAFGLRMRRAHISSFEGIPAPRLPGTSATQRHSCQRHARKLHSCQRHTRKRHARK